MKHVLILLLLSQLLSTEYVNAQTDEILLRSLLSSAQQDINDKQYRSVLRNVEKAKNILGGYTPKLHYLSMKAYIGLNYYDDARKEIKSYFDIAKEDDPNFNEMVLMISKIDDIESGQEEEKIEISQKRDKEQEEWEKTQKVNTIDAYKTFLRTYPNSENASIANQNINHFSNLILKEEINLRDKYYKDYKRKRTLKRLLGWGGLTLAASSIIIGIYADYDFPYTEVGYYDSFTGDYIYDEKLSNYAISALVGTGLMTTSFFISSKKRKRIYEDQKLKVNQLEQNLSLGLTLLNTSNSTTVAYTPGLNIKFSF